MCGRYVMARATSDLMPLFEVEQLDDGLPGPSYNIAPSMTATVVMESAKQGHQGRRLTGARWGLVPPFKKSLNDRPTPHNVTVEKVRSSPMFRAGFAKRRVILPASGFYERRKGDWQSFYITPVDESEMLALAGICDWWADPSKAEDDPSRWILSTAIITRPAQEQMVEIHHREPLYLTSEMYSDWLDPHASGSQELIEEVMGSSAQVAADLEFRRIGSAWLPSHRHSRIDDESLLQKMDQG